MLPCALILLFASSARAAGISEPATDSGARYFIEAVSTKIGPSTGPDSRPIEVLSIHEIPAVVSTSFTIIPSKLTWNTDGAVSKSFPDATIALTAYPGNPEFVFEDGHELTFQFTTPAGSRWSSSVKKGVSITTKVSKEPVQVTLAGDPQIGGNSIVISNIAVTYAGVEFLKSRTWTLWVDVYKNRRRVAIGSVKLDVLPGSPIR